MRSFLFLIPAALAGVVVAAIAVAFDLDAAWSYALIGVVGLLVLISGALQDLGVDFQGREIVKVHEAAIRAENYDGPEAGKLLVRVDEWKEDWIFTDKPMRVTARRTRLKSLFLEKLHKRRKVTFGHWLDPTQKSHA